MEESFAQIRKEITDEYEKRSVKLSECLKSMESIYEKQKQDSHKKYSCLEAENRELKKKLDTLQLVPKSKHEHEGDSRRVKELESKIKELNQELQKKEELAGYRRKRDDWAKMKLEAEVKALRKKATVGWMLGSLWEVSLQGDELGETISMVKMLRKLQKDLERENLSLTGGSTEALDKDIQVLFDNVHAVIQKSGNAKLQQGVKKDESSQANGPASPPGERMTRSIGTLLSPRSPTSPTSPKSPRMMQRANESHSKGSGGDKVSFAGKDGVLAGAPPNVASALQEMHALCENPDSFEGTGIRTWKGRGDIKQMLSSIDANIKALLESERKRASNINVPAEIPNSNKPSSPPPAPKSQPAWKA